jgi:hypothetical protein
MVLRIQILKKAISKPLLQLIFMGVGAENIDKEKEEYFISRLLHLKQP